jgi:transcription antitermination factor NusG
MLAPLLIEPHWYAPYTVARHEKMVAEQLVRRSIESFLPVHRAVRYWKKRRAQIELPLFPSYLFVRASAAKRLRVLEISGVVHIVTFQGMSAAVPDEEIEGLHSSTPAIRTLLYLAAGRRIRVKAGPLQGLTYNSSPITPCVDILKRRASEKALPRFIDIPTESGTRGRLIGPHDKLSGTLGTKADEHEIRSSGAPGSAIRCAMTASGGRVQEFSLTRDVSAMHVLFSPAIG